MSSTLDRAAGLSPDEKRALLARLLREKAAAKAPADAGVHRRFEARAAERPEATAVVIDGEAVAFGDLDARANRLARRLRAAGVGRGTLVGLCADRSIGMVAGLLAVLKAGGAYVPLDPAYPPDRLAYMLADSGAPVVLASPGLVGAIPAGDARVVPIDAAEGEDGGTLGGTTAAADLSYVIYTSGSTGRPKGVEVPHGALGNFLWSMAATLGFGRDHVLLAVTTLSFDIAALELLLPLTVGGRVEFAGREEAADGPALARRIEGAGVDFLQATPATWRLLLAAGWPGREALTMLCGGEALPRALADKLLPKGRALWNLYGPTETTVWSSAGRVEPGEGPVPIGRAIANTQLYVLDPKGRPVPTGVAGELHIGGHGLARGYLGRPAMTAERFVPDPFGPRPGGRMYRTGDLARWLADGALECLGRLDHQVKVRGFRVELGEVESALLAQAGVAEAVAVAREDATGEQMLVGYVVPAAGGAAPAPAELRRALLAALPDHMVPSHFVALDRFPLTPNGKVDRGALPAPEASRAAASAAYIPPRTAIEEAVAAGWAEVMGLARVGARDDFFDLGGHSLLAAQLLARLRDAIGAEVSLKDFFENPTVAGLAHRFEDALRAGSGEAVPPIGPVDRSAPLPASFAQQRLWFLDQLEPGSAAYNLPVAVRLAGRIDLDRLGRSFDALVARHESLRTTFGAIDGRPIQVVAPPSSLPLPIDDLAGHPEADREAEAMRRLAAENNRPFDLAAGPLIRARLFRLGPEEHVAVVVMHHIISDGWSIGVLVRDLGAFYDGLGRGEADPLPPLAVQYADHAAWERSWLRGEALQTRLDYWTGALAGLPNLELPTDRPRPPIRRGRGGSRAATLPAELGDALKALGRAESATPFMAMLASFQVLLARYSGQDDLAVGSPIAGRTRSEVEDLIGFFANTVVFRGDLTGDPSFAELLGRTRRAVLDALGRQDLPFDQLVTALRPQRDPSRTPLFQVMFALQNAPLPPLESPELAMKPILAGTDTARADLTMFLFDDEAGLTASLEYDADLFDPGTIDRMLGHWRTLIESIVADPARPISGLAMLSEAEQAALLGQGGPEGAGADLDGLSEAELDAMIQQLESGHDA